MTPSVPTRKVLAQNVTAGLHTSDRPGERGQYLVSADSRLAGRVVRFQWVLFEQRTDKVLSYQEA